MRYLYLLPKKDFFLRGYRGSVIHALGIIYGFKYNNSEIKVLHYGGLENFISDQQNVKLQYNIKGLIKLIRIVRAKNQRIIIRYSISYGLLLLLIKTFSSKDNYICLEVNTVAKMYNKTDYFYKLIHLIEHFIIRNFNFIYVVSNNAKLYLINSFKLNPDQIIVLPNALISPRDLDNTISINIEKTQKLHVLPKIENSQRLVYLGSLHRYYDIYNVCKWVCNFNIKYNRNIKIHIYGNDDDNRINIYKEEFQTLIEFHGKFDNNKIPELLYKNDILVLPYKKNTIAEYGSPTKLFEYMWLEKPILASKTGQVSDILTHSYDALLYESQEEFEKGLFSLLTNSMLGQIIAKNAKQNVVNNHTWTNRVKYLINFWNKM